MLVTVTGEFRGMKSIHDYIIPAYDINELARLVDEAEEVNIKSVVIKAIGMDRDIKALMEKKYEEDYFDSIDLCGDYDKGSRG